MIGHETRVPVARADALLQHEVGTHIVTYFNGRAGPFKQLYCGLAGYEELQEGLAVLSEYLAGGLSHARLRLLAARVVAASCLVEGASFIEAFRVLNQTFGFAKNNAFKITARIYRGGGLTKDAVYLRGLIELLQHLSTGGELEPLFVGKISIDHIPIIKELQYREILHEPLLKPRYMSFPQTAEKLERLRKGISIFELI